jgi:hypothetical protein
MDGSLDKLIEDLIDAREVQQSMNSKLEDVAHVLYDGVHSRLPVDEICDRLLKTGGWKSVAAFERCKVCRKIAKYKETRSGLESTANEIISILNSAPLELL